MTNIKKWSVWFLLGVLGTGVNAERPNVLFLCADDWNDWIGCLGGGQAKTPNVDQLAKMGCLFTNAHCAAPVCNPSRAAVMSGLRPSTTGVYENSSPLHLALPDGHLTLPSYFRKHGYMTHGGGKIYHDVIGFNHPGDWDHFFLWNEIYREWAWECGYSRLPDPQPEPRPFAKITRKTKRNFDFAPVPVADAAMPDFMSSSDAIEFLDREHDKPFFLAIGQFKPHVPWFAPQEYFDMYPLESIELPPVMADDVDDLPAIARKRALDSASKHDQVVALGEWKKALQGYLACISFADAQIGRVLDALEASDHAKNTIIVFWSDHGYHLGEKGHWHKRTLWERSTRVPYIVVAPGVTTPGSVCEAPVDLMSVYPTLVELSGLEAPERIRGEGRSVVPLLREPGSGSERVALTTHMRGNHAVRTARYRYIRYADGSEELYDHRDDPNEWTNLAGRKEHRVLMDALAGSLPKEEAEESATYSNGKAVLKLEGESYRWALKSEAGEGFVNPMSLKGKAFKAAAEAAPSLK